MEITAEQISANWEIFIDRISTYISQPRKAQLLSFYKQYEDRLVMMPASHKVAYHNCFPGGYIDHVNRVVTAALETEKIWIALGATKNWTTEELVFSAINHDLGKMGNKDEEAYIPQTDAWRKDKLNEQYTFNTKLTFMSVPDRSLFLLTQHGISYSENEYLAIKLHDGIYDEANKPYLMSFLPESRPRTSLVFIIHQADMIASRIEFEHEWFPKFGTTTPTTPSAESSPSFKLSNKSSKKERTETQLKTLANPSLSKAMGEFFK
jgi:hypothetical protein